MCRFYRSLRTRGPFQAALVVLSLAARWGVHPASATPAPAELRGALLIAAAPEPPVSRITKEPEPSDLTLQSQLQPGQVAIEYIAHACFRIHTPKTRLLIDPYMSRAWPGYDFPPLLAADAVLITHPHWDHDAGVWGGQKAPWTPEVTVRTEPGSTTLADVQITGVRGKHADPYGKEFGQKNTIWLIEIAGLRIAHVGDNGPLTAANVRELGRIDILMLPIDAKFHILKDHEIRQIRSTLRPRVLIPMHYQPAELQAPEIGDLGTIDPWLVNEKNVVRLDRHYALFSAGSLLPAEMIIVFRHSPDVPAPNRR